MRSAWISFWMARSGSYQRWSICQSHRSKTCEDATPVVAQSRTMNRFLTQLSKDKKMLQRSSKILYKKVDKAILMTGICTVTITSNHFEISQIDIVLFLPQLKCFDHELAILQENIWKQIKHFLTKLTFDVTQRSSLLDNFRFVQAELQGLECGRCTTIRLTRQAINSGSGSKSRHSCLQNSALFKRYCSSGFDIAQEC